MVRLTVVTKNCHPLTQSYYNSVAAGVPCMSLNHAHPSLACGRQIQTTTLFRGGNVTSETTALQDSIGKKHSGWEVDGVVIVSGFSGDDNGESGDGGRVGMARSLATSVSEGSDMGV
ncbi:hypothetical protein Tco_0672361 [Tanacetum coccineum]